MSPVDEFACSTLDAKRTALPSPPSEKYYHVDSSYIKRSLRPHEWQHSPFRGLLCIPCLGNQRLLNEAAALRFIRQNTNIPVPNLYACFEDDGAVCLVTEYIDSVTMAELAPEQRKVVEVEIEGHVATLRCLKSNV